MAGNQADPANQVQPQQGNPAAKRIAENLPKAVGNNTSTPKTDDLKRLAAQELGIFKPDIYYLT